jgi:hypothetical protein
MPATHARTSLEYRVARADESLVKAMPSLIGTCLDPALGNPPLNRVEKRMQLDA